MAQVNYMRAGGGRSRAVVHTGQGRRKGKVKRYIEERSEEGAARRETSKNSWKKRENKKRRRK